MVSNYIIKFESKSGLHCGANGTHTKLKFKASLTFWSSVLSFQIGYVFILKALMGIKFYFNSFNLWFTYCDFS